MSTYLQDHPPSRSQYRRPRRAKVTGGVCVHTAENATDLKLPDDGAEGVASFISTRDTPGSYHSLVDSTSVVRVVPYEWEAFGDGTGSNPYALHLSFACRAAQWPTLPAEWRIPALRNGAAEAAAMARWVKATRGITVPADHITAKQYRDGVPGFVGHGQLDPDRRSDPGLEFPWDEFLAYYADEMAGRPAPPAPPAPVLSPAVALALEVIDMPLPTEVKFTWSLLDLPDCQTITRELYRLTGNTDEKGMAYWDGQMVRLLEQGRDPRPLLAEISKQLREAATAGG